MRACLVVVLALTGCKYIDQPKKTAALERRLDALADRVSELTGEPVADSGGDEDARAGKGKTRRGKDAREGAKAARDGGKRDRRAKAARDDARDGDRDDARDGARGGARDGDEADDAGAAAADDDRSAASRVRTTPPPPPAPEPVALAPRAGVAWSYQGADGPAAWAKLDPSFAACAGAAQSPIDILPRRSQAPEVIFVYHPAAATVTDDGHGLAIAVDDGGFIVVDGVRYDLVDVRVHTPAEHTIAGDTFPMELELVHRSKAGAVAMIGVLYTEGAASAALAPVWKRLPKGRGAARLKAPLDVDALLPKDRAAYRYDGSLTTPPCSEGVVWHVLRRPRAEDERVIASLRRRSGDTARPVQELGERTVR